MLSRWWSYTNLYWKKKKKSIQSGLSFSLGNNPLGTLPITCKQQEYMECFLGSEVSTLVTSVFLSYSAHRWYFSVPISSPHINPWDHIKWNSELAIPLLKTFWGVLLRGLPDPECEPPCVHHWAPGTLLCILHLDHHVTTAAPSLHSELNHSTYLEWSSHE